jgi:hypothetical protein
MYPLDRSMFEPKEESLVLEIVRGFFDIPSDEMMKIGDRFKMLLFDPQTGNEQEAVAKLKEALKEMPKEHVLMAGLFISGLLRCNLAQQVEQQYMQAKAEGKIEHDCGCD